MFSRFSGIAVLILIVVVAGSAQSTISGQLLKSDGKPLAWTEIEMVPLSASKFVDDPRLNTISDARGNFKFADLPRAKYTLSINFGEEPSELSPYEAFFFPDSASRDSARVFDLTTAAVIDKLVFKLPAPVKFLAITGSVRAFDGSIVKDALIAIIRSDNRREPGLALMSVGPKGEFRLMLRADRQYRVAAVRFDRLDYGTPDRPKILGFAASETFTLDRPGMRFDLKLISNPTREQIRLIVGGDDEVSLMRRPVFPSGD